MSILSVTVVGSAIGAAAFAVGCQGRPASSDPAPVNVETPPDAIELRTSDGSGATVVSATVVPGQPCRAKVDGVELLVGGRPLVAQIGTTRWDGEDTEYGTTLRKNDQPVARIHANQLFDHEGAPVVRVTDSGDILDGGGRIVRRASVAGTNVRVERAVNPGQPPEDVQLVTGTTDIVLAAMLSARETTAEIRALAACHYLLPGTLPASPAP